MSRKIRTGLCSATAARPATPLAALTTRRSIRWSVSSMILRIVGLSSITTTTGWSAMLTPRLCRHQEGRGERPRGHRATAVGGEGPRTYDPYGKLCGCWSIPHRGVRLRDGCRGPLGGGILAFQAREETIPLELVEETRVDEARVGLARRAGHRLVHEILHGLDPGRVRASALVPLASVALPGELEGVGVRLANVPPQHGHRALAVGPGQVSALDHCRRDRARQGRIFAQRALAKRQAGLLPGQILPRQVGQSTVALLLCLDGARRIERQQVHAPRGEGR